MGLAAVCIPPAGGPMSERLFLHASVLLISAAVTACSSDDSSQSSLAPFDSGSVTVAEAGAQPAEFIQVQVQGQGMVESSDVATVDGGLVGQVICSASTPAADCMARQRTTLYALPAEGWVVSGWSTTGLVLGHRRDAEPADRDVRAAGERASSLRRRRGPVDRRGPGLSGTRATVCSSSR
jgi:hypothetical protein